MKEMERKKYSIRGVWIPAYDQSKLEEKEYCIALKCACNLLLACAIKRVQANKNNKDTPETLLSA